MAVKTILNFLVLLAALGVVGGLGFVAANSARNRPTRPGVIIAVVSLIVVLVVGPLNAGLVLVQPNERAIVFRQTSTGDAALLTPLEPGFSWVIPFIDQVQNYDVGQQSVTMAAGVGPEGEQGGRGPVEAISSDGQSILVDVTVLYRIDPAQVNRIHRDWRSGFQEGFIVPVTRSEVRNAINNFGAEQIYAGGRAALEGQIREELAAAFVEQGFLLTDIRIRNIAFTEDFANAVEQKQIAEQEAQRAVFLVQQAQQEAESARERAQGEADAAVIRAQGDAQSIIVRAEAEAEALDLINEVIAENPNLIQYEYINELGDQVQLILVPSDSPFLFDLEALGGGAVETVTPAPATPTPAPTPIPDEVEEETNNP